MNLIACCPCCQTSYRVVHDQLRISDGWVRCGECGEIFDASLQVADAVASATEAPVRVDNRDEAQPLIPEDLGLDEQPVASPSDIQQASSLSSIDSSAAQDVAAESAPEGSWVSAALLIKPSSESDAGEPAATGLALSAAPVSFMLASDATSGPRRERRPVLWWGMGAVLLCGLLIQGLYRERDQLGASFPAIRPALVSACEWLDCRLAPLQGIENLAIDSATFRQVGQDTFELRFVVKNKARFELALPVIELTLTDLADQPVMRRVFTPTELGVVTATVASAGEWSATAYVQLRANATDARAQGYRLLIFYP